eukprot:367232-Rhodomonas_salina.2
MMLVLHDDLAACPSPSLPTDAYDHWIGPKRLPLHVPLAAELEARLRGRQPVSRVHAHTAPRVKRLGPLQPLDLLSSQRSALRRSLPPHILVRWHAVRAAALQVQPRLHIAPQALGQPPRAVRLRAREQRGLELLRRARLGLQALEVSRQPLERPVVPRRVLLLRGPRGRRWRAAVRRRRHALTLLLPLTRARRAIWVLEHWLARGREIRTRRGERRRTSHTHAVAASARRGGCEAGPAV